MTTHVLDTARGQAAVGMKAVLLKDGTLLRMITTNADGRGYSPLLEGEAGIDSPFPDVLAC